MRRRWVVAVVVAGALVAGGTLVVRRYLDGDRTTAVPVDEAVEDFRAQTTIATTTTAAAVPSPPNTAAVVVVAPQAVTVTVAPPTTVPVAAAIDPGVYEYATVGSDSIDVLSGATHVFPDRTAMTVTQSACGVEAAWQTAQERHTTWTFCPDGSVVRTTQFDSLVTFFGVTTTEVYACDGARPVVAAPGTTFAMRCSTAETTTQFSAVVVGDESLVVEGVAVPVQHVRYDGVVSGKSTGTHVTEQWVIPATGLVVREQSTTETSQSTPLGKTTYREQFERTLVSLTPRR